MSTSTDSCWNRFIVGVFYYCDPFDWKDVFSLRRLTMLSRPCTRWLANRDDLVSMESASRRDMEGLFRDLENLEKLMNKTC